MPSWAVNYCVFHYIHEACRATYTTLHATGMRCCISHVLWSLSTSSSIYPARFIFHMPSRYETAWIIFNDRSVRVTSWGEKWERSYLKSQTHCLHSLPCSSPAHNLRGYHNQVIRRPLPSVEPTLQGSPCLPRKKKGCRIRYSSAVVQEAIRSFSESGNNTLWKNSIRNESHA